MALGTFETPLLVGVIPELQGGGLGGRCRSGAHLGSGSRGASTHVYQIVVRRPRANAVFPRSILRWAPCQRLCIHSLARTFWKGWVGAHSHFVDEGKIQELASGGPHPWRPLSFLPGSGTWGWTISR